VRRKSSRELGEAEVEHLHAVSIANEDVRRLDIPMHDALGMGGLERVGELNPDVEDVYDFQRPSADSIAQRLALERFHDDERRVTVLADVVNRADGGVAERACGARLDAESFERLGFLRPACGEELERNLTSQARVFGQINHTHPAGAERAEDSVVRNGSADQGS